MYMESNINVKGHSFLYLVSQLYSHDDNLVNDLRSHHQGEIPVLVVRVVNAFLTVSY